MFSWPNIDKKPIFFQALINHTGRYKKKVVWSDQKMRREKGKYKLTECTFKFAWFTFFKSLMNMYDFNALTLYYELFSGGPYFTFEALVAGRIEPGVSEELKTHRVCNKDSRD